ncbi:adenosine nucleotide hydrolase [Candidatus Atribacteria bacterium RBG_19FT_COMBO_35_14]|uniref:Adenosine nucleotide hydrolase n=1 Tax=Candidatus Sediminicultor quintus TaxID=1797291 RepID=A0A1F5A635_9BACT|nr:MAG: adenosine nucleotide hydrolase [Candidatus Atribacteria bacterium RBG_19FT_COMBO_35_14]
MNNKTFFCSWSGGKDSCLSMYYALKQVGIPKRLITMLIENGERSMSHGLSLNLLKKQSESLNIYLSTYATSWEDYEIKFITALKEIKESGINIGVFGDIDIEDHKKWVKKVCNKTNILEYLPLWKKLRRKIVQEFIDDGFKAIIVAVKDKLLDKELLGRELDKSLIRILGKKGVDLAGENGEYHTMVTGGPIFKNDIEYKLEEKIFFNGYWFQNVSVEGIKQ